MGEVNDMQQEHSDSLTPLTAETGPGPLGAHKASFVSAKSIRTVWSPNNINAHSPKSKIKIYSKTAKVVFAE